MIKKHFWDDYDEEDFANDPRFQFPSFFDDDEDEEDDDEEEKDLKDAIDDEEMLQYFDDAKMSTSSRSLSTTFKKKKPEVTFEQGENVLYRNKEATVVFGPYEKNYKKLYEIQTQDGKIITATSSALHKIKK